MKSIRILLSVTEGSPELYAALTTIPSRLRAERVRALATIGVAAMTGGKNSFYQTDPEKSGDPSQPSNQDSGSSVGKAQAIAKRLGGGL